MQSETRDGVKDLGVSSCYVFKSRLQEYAQKVGFPSPVYETIKEGPSHEPSFRSTVIVKDSRYHSLLGFSNRKAAEQSAAEVALVELCRSGKVNHSITVPVHETGLCKNLLQEYAQKMNYAIPLYQCQKEEAQGRAARFSCTVEIGGIRYIGACAKTKKEAEIKAARTALLAIQSSTSQTLEKQDGHSHLTVIPCRKRAPEPAVKAEENGKRKFKKQRFHKRPIRRKRKTGEKSLFANLGIRVTDEMGLKRTLNNFGDQVVKSDPLVEESRSDNVACRKETCAVACLSTLPSESNVGNGVSTAPGPQGDMLTSLLDKKNGDNVGSSQRQMFRNMEIHANEGMGVIPSLNSFVDQRMKLGPPGEEQRSDDVPSGKEPSATAGLAALPPEGKVENGDSSTSDYKKSDMLCTVLDAP